MTQPQPQPPGARIAERAPAPRRLAVGSAWAAAVLVWIGCLALAVAPLADDSGVELWDPWVARIGAASATWFALVLLAWRIGGSVPVVACLAGAGLALVVLLPRDWVLASAAVVAATSYGLLAMVTTRPSAGLRPLREAVVVAVIGAAGAVVVTGYDVGLRPYRFRVMVLALTLTGGLALAWRLGLGFHSLGRRGLALIVGAVIVLVAAVAYVQAVRHWGSSRLVESVTDAEDVVRERLGASPRLVEAFVGFPAIMWGVAVRTRRRQGWWMSAFGALAAAGVATSLVQPSVHLVEAVESTGYNVLIGCLLGLVLVGVDSLVTGAYHQRRVTGSLDPQQPEPGRAARLG